MYPSKHQLSGLWSGVARTVMMEVIVLGGELAVPCTRNPL